MTDKEPPKDFASVLGELGDIQQILVDSLRRARDLREAAKGHLPEVPALVEAPMEAILRLMVDSDLQAAEDRKQVVLLLTLVDKLQITMNENAVGLGRIEEAAALVAAELAASQGRANAVSNGEPGAAADAGMQGPHEE